MALSAEERDLCQIFPRLHPGDFEITSQRTTQYNCIAWAAGDQSTWWWPGGRYWPQSIPPDDSIQAFVQAFCSLGFVPCADGVVEIGFNKIALYADNNGCVKHAARQLPDGRWSSKLGKEWDITHHLIGLEGQDYGHVVKFMKCSL